MPRGLSSTTIAVDKPKLLAHNAPAAAKTAVSFQDLNKRPTATQTMRKGRSLSRGGRR